jgi:Brp/Blh family beta-carotene 15,15'-monooxygenase
MEELLIELLYFGLIHLAFFALPLLIGFTLYFILLHSIKVLKEEFVYLERKEESMQLPQFLKLLLPLTLLALFGGGLLIIFLELNLINISYPLLFLILLSAITSPHSLVMERFYRQFKAL